MSRLDLPNYTTENRSEEELPERANGKPAGSGESAPQGPAEGVQPSAINRAEAIADRVSHWVSGWGRKVAGLTAYLREAMQDMWAEAQDIRRKK